MTNSGLPLDFEDLFQALTDAVREPMLVLDQELNVRTANAVFYRHFNLKPWDLEGRPILEVAKGFQDLPALRSLLVDEIPKEKVIKDRRLEGDLPGLGRTILLLNAQRIGDAGSRNAYILLAFEDITEREKASVELAEARSHLELMVASVKDYAFFSTDPDRRVTYWNKGAENMFQWTDQEMLGRMADVIFTPEDRENGAPAQETRTAADKGKAMDERWHLRKDGSRFFASGVVTPVRDDSGKIIHFIKVARDITERVRHEQALKESKDHADMILNSTLEGIYGIDRDGICIFANANCAKLLGFESPEGIVGKETHALFHHSYPDGRPYPKAACEVSRIFTAANGQVDSNQEVFWRKDGTSFPAELHGQLMRRDGEVIGAVVTFLDISGKKRLEDQLKLAEERRHQSQTLEAVGRLAGGVAHEFNNALTAINGFADLLLKQTGPDDPRHLGLEEILKAGSKAAAVTQHLLAFGRKQVLFPKIVLLNVLISSLEKLLRKLIGDDAELRLRLAEDLWPTRIDPSYMERVLLNLAMNSWEAMDGKGVLSVETRNSVLQEDHPGLQQVIPKGEYVILSFSDTGKGIPPEMQDILFEPFSSTKPMGNVTAGLGLPSLFGFIQQSGGYLKFESEEGKGTRFTLYLPKAAEVGQVHPAPARMEDSGVRPSRPGP